MLQGWTFSRIHPRSPHDLLKAFRLRSRSSALQSMGGSLSMRRAAPSMSHCLRRDSRNVERIFKGIESDILVDGSLDYPDEVLAMFDFVIGSVHSRFNLLEEDQTHRICRALTHPYLTMLGHATGRLLLSRDGYRVDLRKVIETAAAHRKIVEINASPHRLELNWRLCGYAKLQGVKFSINPDAHSVEALS